MLQVGVRNEENLLAFKQESIDDASVFRFLPLGHVSTAWTSSGPTLHVTRLTAALVYQSHARRCACVSVS